MSPIAIALDLLLAALMLTALMVGARLNRRLKALRDSQANFAASVAELNEAAGRAEAGLASLRAASEEAHDALLTRIETARSLIAKLDAANQRAERSASVPAAALHREAPPADAKPAPAGARNILAELAALQKGAADVPPPPAFAPTPPRPASRPAVDDELFEGDAAPSPSVRLWDAPLKGDRR